MSSRRLSSKPGDPLRMVARQSTWQAGHEMKFIIITIILPVPHDSEICPDGVQNTASRHKRAGGATLYKSLAVARHDVVYS